MECYGYWKVKRCWAVNISSKDHCKTHTPSLVRESLVRRVREKAFTKEGKEKREREKERERRGGWWHCALQPKKEESSGKACSVALQPREEEKLGFGPGNFFKIFAKVLLFRLALCKPKRFILGK